MHTASVPGLLLLGQRDGGEHRDHRRDLMLMRCPSSAITEWELEIGMQPDPRVAEEVLPGKTNVSVSGRECVVDRYEGIYILVCVWLC